jgi:hypothetical protein
LKVCRFRFLNLLPYTEPYRKDVQRYHRIARGLDPVVPVLTLSPVSGSSPSWPWTVISLSTPPSCAGVTSTAVGPGANKKIVTQQLLITSVHNSPLGLVAKKLQIVPVPVVISLYYFIYEIFSIRHTAIPSSVKNDALDPKPMAKNIWITIRYLHLCFMHIERNNTGTIPTDTVHNTHFTISYRYIFCDKISVADPNDSWLDPDQILTKNGSGSCSKEILYRANF